jgi:hypothetical protein
MRAFARAAQPMRATDRWRPEQRDDLRRLALHGILQRQSPMSSKIRPFSDAST